MKLKKEEGSIKILSNNSGSGNTYGKKFTKVTLELSRLFRILAATLRILNFVLR